METKKTTWPLSKLRNWDKNPRAIDKQDFARLKKQIQELGQYKPLLVTPDGEVLGGNMRLRAYQELGINDVWVSVVEPKDETEKVAYALSDNDRAGYYVEQDLAELISSVPDLNLEDYHIDLGKTTDLQSLLDKFGPEVEEDEPPPVPEEAESKYGDVYQLGRHRLMCGDATKIEDVEKLMDGKKADMVFTDPPYNIGFEYNEYEDKKDEEDYEHFCRAFFNNAKAVTTGTIAITSGVWNIGLWYLINRPTWVIAWVKMNGMSRTMLGGMNKWEPVLLWNPLKDKDIDVIGAVTDRIEGLHESHPTIKPIKLISKIIQRFSKRDNVVLDLFGGSGSTLLACEQTNRTCYMLELDEKYVDVIRKRYWKLVNDGKEDGWQEGTSVIQ